MLLNFWLEFEHDEEASAQRQSSAAAADLARTRLKLSCDFWQAPSRKEVAEPLSAAAGVSLLLLIEMRFEITIFDFIGVRNTFVMSFIKVSG